MMGNKQKHPWSRISWIMVFLGAWIGTLYAVHVSASQSLPTHLSVGHMTLSPGNHQDSPLMDLIHPRQSQLAHTLNSFPAQSISRETPESNQHGQKRHKRTLASQAILPDFSVEMPPVTYEPVAYSLFLPPGNPQQFRGSFSLRGPPITA